jgi:hypothetical protein
VSRGYLREQQELVGVDAFATWPVQAAQQKVDAVSQPLDVAIAFVQ